MELFQHWHFQNSFHALQGPFYHRVEPQTVEEAKLLHVNPHTLELLKLPVDSYTHPDFISVFSGNRMLLGMLPLAHDYAGHQFGRFNPLLGDGRTTILGEIVIDGTSCWELSLKGTGRTPFASHAQHADGLAGVSECEHEFHISRRLESLNIPTVHSVAVIQGKQRVYRNHAFEHTAILSRITPTHIRFGTFELYYFQRNYEALQQLCDYVISRHYPECNDPEAPAEERHACFFRRVVARTASLIAHWQAAGFTHGTMNTDNQSIIGITLDLGSAKFTTEFDSEFVANPIDKKGHYAFGNQPSIGLWNCNVLARTLSPLIGGKALRAALQTYEPIFLKEYERLK
ncbi:protein adenylyltransferase SelO family protein [Thiomicrorhabdus heinhorstiae]|uniref:YdiU family protein n=1 Tax=Thiomicrorhabdus heinhorstiae TaxID=2748010 RepID=A0ABS0BUA4_9GAMM|nr:protein adenylyltransferase SelO family protein [Thiomicrorhabdus heinhorstiae]MBF6057420.1 YdiU family protein [Thiomicrorhabdus heinhorstiae]